MDAFPSVANLPTINAAKAGRSVPLKFSLGGSKGLAIFAAGYPQSALINCTTGAPLSKTVNPGSSSLSYSALDLQYSYVWKTDKSWAGACRQLVIKLTDGTTHSANFNFK